MKNKSKNKNKTKNKSKTKSKRKSKAQKGGLFNMSFGLFANFHIRLMLSAFLFWLTVCEKINFYE